MLNFSSPTKNIQNLTSTPSHSPQLSQKQWILWFYNFIACCNLILEAKHSDDSLSNIWRFKQIAPWIHEEIKEIGKYFAGCYTPWLRDYNYAVTNIAVEISTYIQIFREKSFLFRGNSTGAIPLRETFDFLL